MVNENFRKIYIVHSNWTVIVGCRPTVLMSLTICVVAEL